MGINMSEMLPFKGTLVGFVGEQVQFLGHLPVLTFFGSGDNAKSISIKYLIVNTTSPYNIIIERPDLNEMEVVLSTMYLTLKYPL